MVKCTPYPSLANTRWVQQVFGQTPTEARPLGVPKHQSSQGMTEGFWKTRVKIRSAISWAKTWHWDMAPLNFHEAKTILKSNKMGEAQVMTKVGGFFQPIWKIGAFVKLDHETPSSRDEHKQKKIELPPPRKIHGWIPQIPSNWVGFPPT